MSRHFNQEEHKEDIVDPDGCRWLYDEFWCYSKERRKARPPYSAQDIGEDCGAGCRYFEPEPPGNGSLNVAGSCA